MSVNRHESNLAGLSLQLPGQPIVQPGGAAPAAKSTMPIAPGAKIAPVALAAAPAASSAYGLQTCLLWVLSLHLLVYLVGLASTYTASPHSFPPRYATGSPWVAYDSMHYLSIVRGGYDSDAATPLLAYFPAYPLAARSVEAITGLSAKTSLILVANVCFIFGIMLLYAWARELTNARTAFLCAILITCFPGAVFYCAALTEGPFLMLVGAALLLAWRKQWYGAALVCGVATFARPTAIALCAAIVLSYLVQRDGVAWRRKLLHFAGIGLLSISGLIAYEGYLWSHYGQWDVYVQAQKHWEQVSDEQRQEEEHLATAIATPAASATPFASATGERIGADPHHHDAVHKRYSAAFFIDRLFTPQAWNRAMALAMLAVTLAALIWRTGVPRVLLLMPLLVFAIGYFPNHGLRASSLVRYEMASIPLFLVMAIWLAKPARRHLMFALFVCCFAMQLYYAFRFSRGMWVG